MLISKIRATSIFLVIPLTSLPECKITILGNQSQENERREERICTIKNGVKYLTEVKGQKTVYCD